MCFFLNGLLLFPLCCRFSLSCTLLPRCQSSLRPTLCYRMFSVPPAPELSIPPCTCLLWNILCPFPLPNCQSLLVPTPCLEIPCRNPLILEAPLVCLNCSLPLCFLTGSSTVNPALCSSPVFPLLVESLYPPLEPSL